MRPFVRTAVTGGIATLTLDRADQRNAVQPAMLAELAEQLVAVAGDDHIGVVVLAAAGPVFSAGGDLNLLRAGIENFDPDRERALLALALAPIRHLLDMPKPTVALLRGAAAGGGLALALACDTLIAAEKTKLAFAYAQIGLAGDLGMSWLLRQRLGARAACRFALEPHVDAERACRIGLVDEVVADGDLERSGEVLAARLLQVPPRAALAIRTNLHEAAAMTFDAAARMEAESFLALRASADHREAVDAFLEKRPPRFTGR